MRKLITLIAFIAAFTPLSIQAQIFAKAYQSYTQIDVQTGNAYSYKGQTDIQIFNNGITINGAPIPATVKVFDENTIVFQSPEIETEQGWSKSKTPSVTTTFRGKLANGILSIEYFYDEKALVKGLKNIYQ